MIANNASNRKAFLEELVNYLLDINIYKLGFLVNMCEILSIK